jgi:hypothetical protein
MIEPREVKREIRRLRKLKLACRPGTAERLDLEHKIKDLKRQIAEVSISEPSKEKLIAGILKAEAEQKLTPRFADIGIDLHKYTEAELELHLKRITEPRT